MLQIRRVRLIGLVAAALVAVVTSATAQQKIAVDVELALLADASNSIDNAEIQFQRQGYARAITHPDVLSAITKGGYGRIAITFIEWGDETSQETVVPWMIVKDLISAQSFSKQLLAKERRAFGSNAIGAAIAMAQNQIQTNRYEGHRKVIDFSADSANNWNGIPIAEARKNALDAGTIINGLAILCRAQRCSGRPVSYDLEQAFADRIIGGPGSFVITVDSQKTFADAVRRKLILELANRVRAPVRVRR